MPIVRDGQDNILDNLKTVHELTKGDLYVRFDIHFPTRMSNECKQVIVEALIANEELN
jgi:DnaJ-class molecular chaperone